MINWNKPLRTTTCKYAVEVIREQHGNRLVTWDAGIGGIGHGFVNKDGVLVATLHLGATERTGAFVENVPAEPKDHLQLWSTLSGEWRLDAGLRTKTEAERWARSEGEPCYQRRQAVKVPV